MDLGGGSRVVGKNPRYEFERVRVPVVGHARLFEHVRKMARCLGLGEFVQSLRQVLLVDTRGGPLLREVPVGKVGVFVLPVERVVDDDSRRKKGLGNAQDLAAVCSVAVVGKMCIHGILEPVVVALVGVGGGCCEAPAHVLLARYIMSTCILIEINFGDLVELSTDFLRDLFDDVGVGFGGGKVVAQERLVEGEDTFDFDAEGDLERGVDHVDGF